MNSTVRFPDTLWTEVLAAAGRSDPETVRSAIVRLCEHYHEAILAWYRRHPLTRDRAEDLTQEFLVRWMAKEAPLGDFRRGPRRFREFLVTCLRHFGASDHARRTARKRGGEASHVALDEAAWVAEAETAERLDWEVARVLRREVEAELASRWKPRLPEGAWDRLRPVALGDAEARDYGSISAVLGVPVGSVKGWVFRIRQEHYDEFVRRVRCLAAPDEVAFEVRHLLSLLARYGTEPESR